MRPRVIRRRCACGCRRRVNKARAKYFSRACQHRLIPREVRQQWGREGARVRMMGFRMRIVSRLRDLSFEAAVLKAFELGRRHAYREKGRAA